MKDHRVRYEERMKNIIADEVSTNENVNKEDYRKSVAIYEEASKKMENQGRFLEHERAYMSARNIAMFIFKFVVPNFKHYQHKVKANHEVAMFIISKKAYLDLKALRDDILG